MTGERRGWAWEQREVDARIECGGDDHRIAWRRGRLVLCDHDLRAEAALQALGGPRPACLEVLDAWRRYSPRTAQTPPNALDLIRRHGRYPDWAVVLPGRLATVRELTLAAKAERRGDLKLLTHLLSRRARVELGQWVAATGEQTRVWVNVVITLADGGHEPSLTAAYVAGRLELTARLRPDWLRRIGYPGRALAGGGFVLDERDGERIVARWRDERVRVRREPLPSAV